MLYEETSSISMRSATQSDGSFSKDINLAWHSKLLNKIWPKTFHFESSKVEFSMIKIPSVLEVDSSRSSVSEVAQTYVSKNFFYLLTLTRKMFIAIDWIETGTLDTRYFDMENWKFNWTKMKLFFGYIELRAVARLYFRSELSCEFRYGKEW